MRAIALLMLICCGPLPGFAAAPVPPVLVLNMTGEIGPGNADYLRQGLARATALNAQLVVLRLDTPGGLELSMREIIRDILASPVPVASFVAPTGARAASAGTYILYASHVAAMSPATNLGAATPVAVGSPLVRPNSGPGESGAGAPSGGGIFGGDVQSTSQTLAKKHTSDAAAYMRGLAQLRGRNADWADRAVREAVSLSAEEALKLNVIDVIAADIPQLLAQLDGRTLPAYGQEKRLDTRASEIIDFPPDWRTRLLVVIADPGVAYVLLMVGVFCLLIEFFHPGLIAPGVIGCISLLIAMFAFQILPVSQSGIALIVLGIGLMIAEGIVPGFGILGIGGISAFVIGSIMLFDTGASGYSVPWPLIAGVAVAGAGMLFLVLNLAMRARRRPALCGGEQMLGAIGEILEGADGGAMARIRGEVWKIRVDTFAGPLVFKRGQMVKVVGIDGLVLDVEPVQPEGIPK
jgi:membrane-bound serine protease (ClpP class)